ncbi:vacuolar fusion protein MON1 homolog A-like [Tubulanus polymorphus]|uniref:vacuolar fusion protein MON1 homolog A-like n=1 Tax=Tubulanus polymorphus TaxID=672921 RepID=UPI003DA36DC2
MNNLNINLANNSTSVDIQKGNEPGAAGSGLIIASSSLEDLTFDALEDEDASKTRRAHSGTISQIVRSRSVHPDDDANQAPSPATTIDTDTNSEDLVQGGSEDTSSREDVCETSSQSSDIRSRIYDADEEDVEPADDIHSEVWRQQKLHVFILSEAGKPIYSRYGKEDKLVTIMGVMQALVSFVQDSKDSLRCIVAGNHKFVFLVREHIMLVCVSRTSESTAQLLMRLMYVNNQIISVLTHSQLARIFKQRRNYDLRRLLSGAEKFIDNLLQLIDCDPSYLLGSVRCLPLASSVRDTIAQTVIQYAKVKDLVFAILIANNQLVTLVRMKKYFLHPVDLHLIINLVSASESFKAAESWTPICLPKFDSSGYLHGHVSYLDEDCHTCLLLLTVDRDMFFTLSDCKAKITNRLNRHHCLEAIKESVLQKGYSTRQVGIPDLRHFIYKSRSTAQFTSPDFEAPYVTSEERERVFSLYQYLHHRIHNSTRPLRLLFHVGEYETLLGWVTAGFELYTVFGPLVTKPIAIHSIEKLLKWIKREEARLFILNSPTF